MNPAMLYLGKVVLCSGVLFGYYCLALRNKVFHQWNRFYLLACVVLSLLAPLLHISIISSYTSDQSQVLHILHVMTINNVAEGHTVKAAASAFTTMQWLQLAYALVSLIIGSICIANGVRIYTILHAYPQTRLNDIRFLNTDTKGTPFSFFRYIVWNRAIDLNSETGQRIFHHELAHVRQQHTWDKLFLLLILVPFWSNPFFWLIRKELTAIHEFAADQKAMQSGDAGALAQLILNTTFPEQQFLFTNHIFQSTIKRRLAMFTKLQNPNVSYWSRIAALPVLFVVIASFALKTTPANQRPFVILPKPITVVIDAGHGSKDGTRYENVYESDLALSIAKQIKAQNTNPDIRLVLTRESDQDLELHKRVDIAAANKADLFISIHVNALDAQNGQTGTPTSGLQVVVSGRNAPYQAQSELLGTTLVQALADIHNTQEALYKPNTGIWVVDHNVCPAVLLECGYLTDKNDRDFITQEKNQQVVASKILTAIAQYAVLKNNGSLSGTSGTAFQSTSKNETAANGAASSTVQHSAPVAAPNTTTNETSKKDTSAPEFKGVIVIDGKVFKGSMKDIPLAPDQIASVNVWKENDALVKEYGPQARNGVIKIITKASSTSLHSDASSKPVFTTTEVEPKFPGGKVGWQAFLGKNLNASVGVTNGAKAGAYKTIVQFIVDENGALSDIKPLTNNGYGMEEEVVRLMKSSPKWSPATQNGRNVMAYWQQPVTFVIAESK